MKTMTKTEWALEAFFASLREQLIPHPQRMMSPPPTHVSGTGPDGNEYGAYRNGNTIEIVRIEKESEPTSVTLGEWKPIRLLGETD